MKPPGGYPARTVAAMATATTAAQVAGAMGLTAFTLIHKWPGSYAWTFGGIVSVVTGIFLALIAGRHAQRGES